MARDGIWLSLIAVVLIVALTATGLGQSAPPSKPLGQVVSASAEVDGIVVPSGTTLLSGNVVQTRENVASVHLTGHPVIRLERNSRARAETTPAGAIKITVESGTLSMRTASGQAITVPANRLLYFPRQAGGAQGQVPSERDVIAVLEVPAAAGSTSITVNDTSKIDASQPIVIRRRGAEVGELHYITSISDRIVTLTAPLNSQFPANSQVLQGETTRDVLTAAGTVDRPPPATVTRGRRSNTPLIVLLSAAAAGGATALILYDGNESTSASPSRP
jgi:hypothetical protein